MSKIMIFFILIFSGISALASTNYVGKIRNGTPYKNEQITVQLTRSCDWFCDVRYWESPEIPVQPDGSWKIVSPYNSAGDFTLKFKTPKTSAYHSIYYKDFHKN